LAQEFFINSQELENKVRNLLPSQGGAGAGFDLSASTQIIPIIDLTESAEGSNFRQDLQTSLSLKTITAFSVENSTSTIINNTGYFRIFGTFNGLSTNSTTNTGKFTLTDGVTPKVMYDFRMQVNTSNNMNAIIPFDFLVKLEAGNSVTATSDRANNFLIGVTRQIADLEGNLTNP